MRADCPAARRADPHAELEMSRKSKVSVLGRSAGAVVALAAAVALVMWARKRRKHGSNGSNGH